MSALGKGTRRELMLAIRAARTCAAHLKAARQGLAGRADGKTLALLIEVQFIPEQLFEVMRVASEKTKARAA